MPYKSDDERKAAQAMTEDECHAINRRRLADPDHKDDPYYWCTERTGWGFDTQTADVCCKSGEICLVKPGHWVDTVLGKMPVTRQMPICTGSEYCSKYNKNSSVGCDNVYEKDDNIFDLFRISKYVAKATKW